ncbi:MAG TPA: hypothetical protein DCM14_08530 [Clostridiales bacterium UBA8153]|nr:hypothetical protein [Clostridiales bacterium UBA8153]
MSFLVWPASAVLCLGLAAWLVPGRRWKELWVTALFGGFFMTFVIQHLLGSVLGAWSHAFPSLMVLGVPAWLGVTWFALVLIFINYLPDRGARQAAYVGLFALIATLASSMLHQLGLRPLRLGWGWLETFLLAYVIHCAVVGIDTMVRHRRN